jgi:hypothetical protein
MTRLAFIALAFAAVAACDPYDPDLGPTPVRVRRRRQRLPRGLHLRYVDIDVCEPTGRREHRRAGVHSARTTQSLEPNDAPNHAYITPIPNARADYALFGLSICPGTDVDHFKFGVNAAGPTSRSRRRPVGPRRCAAQPGTVITTRAGPHRSVDLHFIRVRAADAQENNSTDLHRAALSASRR